MSYSSFPCIEVDTSPLSEGDYLTNPAPWILCPRRYAKTIAGHNTNYSSPNQWTPWPPARSGPTRERVRKKIRVRVRMTCHACGTQFPGRLMLCKDCEHHMGGCAECEVWPRHRVEDKPFTGGGVDEVD
jgi:hypothetical protein